MADAVTKRCPYDLTPLVQQQDGSLKCPVCGFDSTGAVLFQGGDTERGGGV